MCATAVLSIILAAGKGTRMRSAMPKPLHAIAGRSLLAHTMATARSAGHTRQAVVVGPDMDGVVAEATANNPECETFLQADQLGTAHAALAARAALASHRGDVFVLFADTPLLRPETLQSASQALAAGANLVVLGFEAADPTGYGRLLTDAAGNITAIREHREANPEERRVKLCNSGVMAFRCPELLSLLDDITNHNANGEYYLSDAVELARARQLTCRVVRCAESELLGINDRTQLAQAEAVFQNRARRAAMINGATLIAPETVWFSFDTKIGRDVTIEPNVFLGPGVTIHDNAQICANTHLVGTTIGAGARVGPFARMRPGADIGPQAHIGNFVEVKNTTVGTGAKANHLAYLGDGDIGRGANIGAGTIFCNYDGFNKHRTEIGSGAFVGSNASLVAPVKIGPQAYIGSGSVITRDVPGDALALERTQQTTREGWAQKFRRLMARNKT